jgi:hypothetical protein
VSLNDSGQAVVLDFRTEKPVMKGDVPDCWVSRVVSESLGIHSGPIYGIGSEHLAEQVLQYIVANALNELKQAGCLDSHDTTENDVT